MKNVFNKGILRSIRNSMGRFLAIAIMAALGTGFYAGLQMTEPDMKLAGDQYYDGTNLSDIRVMSTLGLTDDDIEALRAIDGVEGVMPAYETDATFIHEGQKYTTRIHSLDVDAAVKSDISDGKQAISSDLSYMNRPLVIEGTWPTEPDECLLSIDVVMETPISLGDTITLDEGTTDLDETLNSRTYTIVGLCRSSYYTAGLTIGTTSLGSGTVDQYMYVPESSFNDEYPYTEAFVTVVGAKDLNAASKAYDEHVGVVVDAINDAVPALQKSRVSGIKEDAQQELDDARAEFEAEIADAQKQYDDGVAELESKRSEAEAAFAQAEQDLNNAQAQYDSAMATRSGLVSQLVELRNTSDEVNSGIGQVQDGISQIDVGLGQLSDGIAQAQEGIAAIDTAIGMLDPADPAYGPTLAYLTQQKQQAQDTLASLQTQEAELVAQKDALVAQEAELQAAYTQVTDGIAQIENGIWQIDSQTQGALDLIATGRSELETSRADAQAEIASAEETLAEAKTEIEDARVEAEKELGDAQSEIDKLENPEIYVLDRSKNMGVQTFFADADRMKKIASVFPFIFFLVAALVSLTTMTRMVEEERVLIGTYKALGYSNMRITSKYLIYAIVASGVGSLIGIVALSQFLPWFIMNAYSIVYSVPGRPTPIQWDIALFSALLGIGITVIATWVAAGSTLRESPASLMLPRAPKAGKRIVLERITPLWTRMSFLWKVTARNIFRYKRRFFMAVIGVAGCTALLLTGLGLQNAINDIIDKQFGELYNYTMVVRAQEDATAEQKREIEAIMDADSIVSGYTQASITSMITTQEGCVDQFFDLVVPQDQDEFADYITLRDRKSHDPIELATDGVVVSEKLADMYDLHVGDTLVMYEQDSIGNASGAGYKVPIVALTEHYVNQYVYMTPAYYEQVFGHAPDFSALYAKVGDDLAQREALTDKLLALDSVKTTGFNDETIGTYRTMLKSVDAVVVILVVAAALLAFVVLYNLTNINITERQREIATLKVLGFTPNEVNAYIYRETILLSMIGALVGLVLGIFMEGFVVTTAEVDMVMFGRQIHALSFLIAFALTMVFSVFVSFAARFKLKKIDMVESLKSVE